MLHDVNNVLCVLPGRFERGQQKYAHVLDGDGYVCSFSFNQEGRVYFRSAYVRTRHVPEATTCSSLYRGLLLWLTRGQSVHACSVLA